MKRFDCSSKNSAIVILLGMWILFFVTAVLFSLRAETKQLASDMWKLFAGANIGLVALLNSAAKGKDEPGSETPPANPTQQ